MGRILAIDYGQKRVGIAVTDPMQIIATGLETLAPHEVIGFIEKYMNEHPVESIVIGFPLQMNGKESESMRYIRPFVKNLKRKFPDMEIVFVDERFTSRLAQRAMIDGGLKKKDRRNKALVDKISATIILQSYIESKNYKQTT